MKISQLLVLCIISFCSVVSASISIPVDDFESYFPAVAQGHLGNFSNCSSVGDHLVMQGSSTIDGSAGASLDYCSNPTWSSGTCDDSSGGRQRCEVTGNPVASISLPSIDPLPSIPNLPSKPAKPSGSFIYSSPNNEVCSGFTVLTQSEYQTLTLNDGCQLVAISSSLKVRDLVIAGDVEIDYFSFTANLFELWATNLSISNGSNLDLGSLFGTTGSFQLNINSFSSPSSLATIQSSSSNLQTFFHQSAQVNHMLMDSDVIYEGYGNVLDSTKVTGSVYSYGDVTARNGSELEVDVMSQQSTVTINQSNVAGNVAAAGEAKLENSANVGQSIWSTASNLDIKNSIVGTNALAYNQLKVSESASISGYTVSNQGNTVISDSSVTGSVYAGAYTSINSSTLGNGLSVIGQFEIQDSVITGNIVGQGSSVYSSIKGSSKVSGNIFKGEGQFDLKGTTEVTGNVYGHGDIFIEDQAGIYGRVSSQRLRMNGQGFVYIEPPVVESFLLWGKVTNQAGDAQGRVEFGSTLSHVPVVFAMSSIDPTNANNDGPIAVQVTAVDDSGFDYWVRIPPGSTTAPLLSDFHWVASSVSDQVQSIDGIEFYAGTTQNDQSLLGPPTINDSNYEDTGVSASDFPVVLTQVQSLNNQQNQNRDECWFTSRSATRNNNVATAIDASEAYDSGNNPRCQPGNVRFDSLNAETVAYLAAKVGTGQVDRDSVSYKFQFGLGETLAGGGVITPSAQCSDAHQQTFQTLLFANPPSIVASINGRAGNNGGWLRRCSVSNTTYNLMVDEDQYQNSERSHLNEQISYLAVEDDPVVNNIDHYRVRFNSSAIACSSQEIQVQACIDEDCTTEYSEPATVDLYKNSSLAQSLSFTGNTTAALWHTNGGSALISLVNGSPDAAMRCFVDGGEVAAQQCAIEYAQAGFILQAPTQLACKNSGELDLFAVEQSTTDPRQCLPLLANQSHNLQLNFEYRDPSVVSNPASLEVTDLSPSGQTISVPGGGSNTLSSVYFDNSGTAKLSVNYPEAGLVELGFKLSEDVDGGGQTIELEGVSQWVSQPQGIYFSGGVSQCTDMSCSVLAKAQENFNFSAQGVCWVADNDNDYSNNPVVQNFDLSSIEIQAKLEAPSIANGDPLDGSVGTITTTSINIAQGAQANAYTQNYSEVGSLSFELSQNLSYLGTTIENTRSTSDHFGRFIPAYLDVVEQVQPQLSAQCETGIAFTYMDQPFGYESSALPSVRVIGYGNLGGITQNYQIGDWWRIANSQQWTGSYSHASLPTPEVSSFGITQFSPSSQSQKLVWLEDTELLYRRVFEPVAPFDAIFDLTVDKLSWYDLDNVCYQDSAAGECLDFVFDDIAAGENFLVRYGRLTMNDVSGSPYVEFSMPVIAQYFDGNAWQTNTDDSCSLYSGVALSDVSVVYDPSLSGDQSILRRSESTTIANGESILLWSASGTSAYSGAVSAPLIVDSWLQWFWQGQGNGLSQPSGKAIFGAFRGHDRVLYWREID